MKHPSEYTTEPFLDMHVMVVDVGSTVTDERSGEVIEITDMVSVKKGNVLFCTQAFYDCLKTGRDSNNALARKLENAHKRLDLLVGNLLARANHGDEPFSEILARLGNDHKMVKAYNHHICKYVLPYETEARRRTGMSNDPIVLVRITLEQMGRRRLK